MKDFIVTADNAKSPEQTHTEMVGTLAPRLSKWGYRLVSDSPTAMLFEWRHTPGWVAIPCLLLFPIGLLFLLVKNTAALSITIAEYGVGSQVTVHGEAPRGLRKQFVMKEDW